MNGIRVGLDVLTSYVSQKTNKILCQLGDVVNELVHADTVEWWQHVGLSSRAPKPTKGESATQTLSAQVGNRTVVFASHDMRALEIYGNLDFGETCLYAPGEDGAGQARVILKNDGSVNVYATDDNTKDGKAVYFRVAPDGFSFVAPWGTLKFDATGFHVNHTSGAQISAGGIYGLPFPLDKLSSYVRMQAGTLNVNASAQSMGGVAGHAPLANAEKLQEILIAIVTALTAGNAGGPIITNPEAVAKIADLPTTTLST